MLKLQFKNFIFVIFILLNHLAFCQQNNMLVIDDINISSNRKEYYKEVSISKNELKGLINGTTYKILPEIIQYFKYDLDQTATDELQTCENYLKKIYSDYKSVCKKQKKDFNSNELLEIWRNQNLSCFGIYKKYAPIIEFKFQAKGDNTSKQFQLDSVQIQIINKTRSKSYGIPRFSDSDIKLPVNKKMSSYKLSNNYVIQNNAIVAIKFWSEHYDYTNIGNILPYQKFVLKFTFVIREINTDYIIKVPSKIILIEI